MLMAAGGARRKARHAVGNQMSIGSEKFPSRLIARGTESFESTPPPAASQVRTRPYGFGNLPLDGAVGVEDAEIGIGAGCRSATGNLRSVPQPAGAIGRKGPAT